jgi:hypothetical protein
MPDYAFGSKEADDEALERTLKRDQEEVDFKQMLIDTVQCIECRSPAYCDLIPDQTYVWWQEHKRKEREDNLRNEAIKRLKAEAANYGLTIEIKKEN